MIPTRKGETLRAVSQFSGGSGNRLFPVIFVR